MVMKQYLVERFQEPSTWRGVILILTAGGVQIAPQMMEAIVSGGLFLAGLIGAGMADKRAKDE
jgi:hypothetical protein